MNVGLIWLGLAASDFCQSIEEKGCRSSLNTRRPCRGKMDCGYKFSLSPKLEVTRLLNYANTCPNHQMNVEGCYVSLGLNDNFSPTSCVILH